MGPDDLNGYGYFPVRLYWTEAGFQAPAYVHTNINTTFLVFNVQKMKIEIMKTHFDKKGNRKTHTEKESKI